MLKTDWYRVSELYYFSAQNALLHNTIQARYRWSDSDLKGELWIVTLPTFSQPRSLCLLSRCRAITLKMNHLPLWVHCFWPGYLLHRHRFCTSLNPGRTSSLPQSLSEFALAVPLSVCNGWIHRQMRLSFLSEETQKHSNDRMKGFLYM